MSPYKVLGVSSLDSKETIRKKYKELAKVYHPDNIKTGDAEKFKAVNDAWKEIDRYHTNLVQTGEIWVHKSIFSVKKEVYSNVC